MQHPLQNNSYVLLKLKEGAYVTFLDQQANSGPLYKARVHYSQLDNPSATVALKSVNQDSVAREFLEGYVDLRDGSIFWADFVYQKGNPNNSIDMRIPNY